jgi:hypothetical protein
VTPFDFRTFLDVAEDLASRNDQVALRTALSRSYYAVFRVSRQALPSTLQTHIGQGRVHRETWNRYTASSHQPCRQIGGIGLRLRRLRELADYEANVSFTPERVRWALDEA